MSQDARFEDAGAKPLNLGAMDAGDLQVISALVQDAILPVSEMKWDQSARRFAMLLNRFRWEDDDAPHPERVQSLLVIDGVLGVSSQGLSRDDTDTVLSVLAITFTEDSAPAGAMVVNFAGDGALRIAVEAVDVMLRDVTRPYYAPSGKVPGHGGADEISD